MLFPLAFLIETVPAAAANSSSISPSLLEMVISALVSVLAYFGVPKLNAILEAKLGADRASLLTILTSQAVRTIEQEALRTGAKGDVKLEAALAVLRGLDERKNLKSFDEGTLKAALEAAVNQLKQEQPQYFSLGSVGEVPAPISTPTPVNPAVIVADGLEDDLLPF